MDTSRQDAATYVLRRRAPDEQLKHPVWSARQLSVVASGGTRQCTAGETLGDAILAVGACRP